MPGRLVAHASSSSIVRAVTRLPAFIAGRTIAWARDVTASRADPAGLTISVVAVALTFRIWVAVLFWHGTLDVMIQGVPISDARNWDALAVDFSRGQRWDAAWGSWGARRPLYYVFMGSIFALTGPSLLVTRAVHILLGTAATGLIFDLCRRLAGFPVACLVALFQALLWANALAALTTMTEPLGDFIAIVALWSFVVAIQPHLAGRTARQGLWGFALAGAALALANLARPLTLFAGVGLPATAAALWLRAGRRSDARRLLTALGVFVAAFALTLAPWLGRQWVRYGILTLSENSAEMLFAATSPRYGAWMPEVSALPPPGIPISQRVAFYNEGTRRNLRVHAWWYVGHVLTGLGAIAWNLGPDRWLLWGAFAFGLGARVGRGAWTPRVIAGLGALGALILACPAEWSAASWPGGLALALWRGEPIALLAGMLGSTMLLTAMVPVPGDLRFATPIEWLAMAYAAWLVWTATAPPRPGEDPPGEIRRHWPRVVLGAALILVALEGIGFAVALSRHRSPAARPDVDVRTSGRVLAAAIEGSGAYERIRSGLEVRRGTLLADRTIHVPAGRGLRHWSPLVAPRPYAYVVLQVRGLAQGYVVFPGALPALPHGTQVFVVGLPGRRGPDAVFEAVAIAWSDPREGWSVARPTGATAALHARELLASAGPDPAPPGSGASP